MRKAELSLALLLLSAGSALAQQNLPPSAESGNLGAKIHSPVRDKDGVYRTGPGIVSPTLVTAVSVDTSASIKTCTPSVTVVSAVTGADGIAKVRDVYLPRHSSCETLGVAAVEQSRFQPGTLNGAPVPILVCVGVPFLPHIKAPIPALQPCPEGFGTVPSEEIASLGHPPAGMKPPVPLNEVEAEYSDEAGRKKFKELYLSRPLLTPKDYLPTFAS